MASYRDCIAAAAEFLRLDDVAAAVKSGKEDELIGGDKDELKLLISCAGFVANEVAAQYVPLYATETVYIKNGKIPFSALSRRCTEIVCVSVGGVKKRFKQTYDGVSLTENYSGKAEAEYNFVPAAPEIDGVLEWESEKLSPRVFGYGIACEYCIINGMSEAVMWDKRYKDALSSAVRQKREMRVKKRRWL